MMQVEWLAILLCTGAVAAAACTLSGNERKADISVLVCGLFLAGAFAAMGLPVLAVCQAAVSVLAWRASRAVTASRPGAVVRRTVDGFGYAAVFLALGLLVVLLVKTPAGEPLQGAHSGVLEAPSLVTPALGLLVLLFAGFTGAIGILRRSRH